MPILLRNIRLDLDAPLDELPDAAAKRLRVPRRAIRAYAVVRRSIDARDKDDIHFRYHIELALNEPPALERKRLRRLRRNEVAWIEPVERPSPQEGSELLPARPIVIGFGPAGMFAALRLAELGYKPLVLERGRDIRRRHRDVFLTYYRRRIFTPESNLLFGEGGAGAYSDGKLYTRVNDPLAATVLEKLYQHGADPDILINARPHIGSDRLPAICRSIRRKIESLGGEVRFDARVDDFHIENGRLAALSVNGERMNVGPVLLAIGHSARDTIRTLACRGVRVDPKPFQIGVRIEHPQEMVDRWQYGSLAGHVGLGPAEYQVVAKGAAGRAGDLFSFCMCPGGMILPTHESPELVATNGASRASRGGEFANSGLVITVDPATLTDKSWRANAERVLKRSALKDWFRSGDELLDSAGARSGPASTALTGLDYQEFWERLAYSATGRTYRVPVQRASDFLARRTSDGQCECSYPLGAVWYHLRAIVPADVAASLEAGLSILDRRMPGYAGAEAVIAAPETRANAAVRITRDRATRQSVTTANLYPLGEGAGYAGGIVSAAVDGLKAADTVVRRYARSA